MPPCGHVVQAVGTVGAGACCGPPVREMGVASDEGVGRDDGVEAAVLVDADEADAAELVGGGRAVLPEVHGRGLRGSSLSVLGAWSLETPP